MEKRSVFWKVGITAVFAVAMALYWYFARPWIIEHQYSIAHFDTIGTFGDALKSVGGLAAFIGSFLQSLFQSPTAGALVQTLVLAVPLQMLVWQNMEAKNDALFLQSFIPSVLLLWITGDRDVLVAFPVALIISLLVAMLMGRKQLFADLVIAPLLYWLLGSAAWVYVLVRIVHCNWRKSWWMAVYMVVAQVLLWLVCKMLNPGMYDNASPAGFLAYHSDKTHIPALAVIIPIVIFLMVIPVKAMSNKEASYRGAMFAQLAFLLIITAFAVIFTI